MRINNNMMAMNTHRQLGIANTGGAKSMEKLSSGFRINRAGDDAAGLAISEKMRGQIRGLNRASTNAQDAISLIQTTEGALNETHAILQRMRELAVQSATDTNTNADRSNLQDEIDQLATEITRISTDTEFNTMKVLNGDFKGKVFHIGSNSEQNISFDVNDMGAKALGVIKTDFYNDEAMATTGLENIEISSKDGEDLTVKFDVSDDENSEVVKNTTATLGKDEDGKTVVTIKLAQDQGVGGAAGAISATEEDVLAALKKAGIDAKVKDGATVGSDALTGITKSTTETITFEEITDEDEIEELGKGKGINISTQSAADKAITTVNDALETVSKERSKLGAIQNRLEHTIKNLDTSAENLQASESRIRDVDMAKEMMEQTKQNILQQASTAMLAQANMAPQTVLQLLG